LHGALHFALHGALRFALMCKQVLSVRDLREAQAVPAVLSLSADGGRSLVGGVRFLSLQGSLYNIIYNFSSFVKAFFEIF
jgi:hypothetical protein